MLKAKEQHVEQPPDARLLCPAPVGRDIARVGQQTAARWRIWSMSHEQPHVRR